MALTYGYGHLSVRQVERFREDLIAAGVRAAADYSVQYLTTLARNPVARQNLLDSVRNTGGRSRLDRFINIGGEPYVETPENPQKRARIEGGDQPMEDPGESHDAGAKGIGNYIQLKFSRSKYGKRKPMRPLRRMYKFVREAMNNVIGRWQTLNSPMARGSLLSQGINFFENTATNTLYMPCYAFNLSGPAATFNVDTSGTLTFGLSAPFYRLKKSATAAGNTRQWSWDVYSGIKNDPLGIATHNHWRLEHQDAPLRKFAEYTHNWSDIRLLLQGRNNNISRFHLYIVQFAYDGLGPVRTNDQDQTDTNSTDPEDIAQCDYFWERFMMPKVVHPFACTKKTGLDHRHLIVHNHEVIEIGPSMSIEADASPLQYIKRIFYRNDKTYSVKSPMNCEQRLMPVGVDPNETTGLAGTQLPGYSNVQGNEVVVPYPTRRLDKWLLIVMEDYDKTSPDVPPTKDNCASFDLVVRSKYTYYSDS